jgi:hypothetical protein
MACVREDAPPKMRAQSTNLGATERNHELARAHMSKVHVLREGRSKHRQVIACNVKTEVDVHAASNHTGAGRREDSLEYSYSDINHLA